MNGESSGERIIASDNYITRNDVTGEFSALECNLPGDVIYTPGECAVSIYAPDNILDIVTVRNQNGTLEIKTNTSRIRNLKHVKINISSPVLENVVFNGAVDFNAPQGITALDFRATVNGAGDIDINGLQSSKASGRRHHQRHRLRRSAGRHRRRRRRDRVRPRQRQGQPEHQRRRRHRRPRAPVHRHRHQGARRRQCQET